MKTAGERRISGWHREQAHYAAGDFGGAAAPVTAWERQLRELGLGEDQALSVVKSGGAKARVLAAFVRRVSLRRFVPEAVLEAMGLRLEVENARTLTARVYGDD